MADFWATHAGPSNPMGKEKDQDELDTSSRTSISKRLKHFGQYLRPSQKPKKGRVSPPPSEAPGAPAIPSGASCPTAPQPPSTPEPGEVPTTLLPSSGRSGARAGLSRFFRSSGQRS
ncbi:hypothetical protein PAXINDRAFT_94956 [Paxillus involutus ATCC 200175]|nr:hypothetical protein PAXINDRAFT_94956 [Paxillus involutus ATCC 200175]